MRVKEVATVAAGVVAVLVGLIWRAYDLIAIGAGGIGLPEIFNSSRERGKGMFKKNRSKLVDREAEPGSRFQPEADVSVFLPEDNENQTSVREEFVKNLGLDKS